MKKLIISAFVSAMAVTSVSTHAFGLGDVAALGKKSTPAAGATDLVGAQDQLVKQYVSAGKSVLEGNSKMAEAVGLATEAATARAAAAALGDGATKGNLSDADKAASQTNTALAEKLKNTETLDGPSKAKFSEGMLNLAQGLGKYVGMNGSFSNFQKSLSTASPMQLPQLQSGAYIVTSFPSSLQNLSSALKSAVSYAQSHDIPVPKDATDVMSKL